MIPKFFIAIAWLLLHRFTPEVISHNGYGTMRHFQCNFAFETASGCGLRLREPIPMGKGCGIIHDDEIPPCMRAIELVCNLAFPPREEIILDFPNNQTITYDGGKTEEPIVLPPHIFTSLNVRIAMMDAAEIMEERATKKQDSVAELLRDIDQYLDRTAVVPE